MRFSCSQAVQYLMENFSKTKIFSARPLTALSMYVDITSPLSWNCRRESVRSGMATSAPTLPLRSTMVDNDKMVSVPETLIEDVQDHLHRYNRATDRANAGHHLIELFNKVGDLSTWHSGYDERTGTLPWEREDEE